MNITFMYRHASKSFGIKRIIICVLFILPIVLVAQSFVPPSIEIKDNKRIGFEPFKPAAGVPRAFTPIRDNRIDYMDYRLVSHDQVTQAREEICNWPDDTKGQKIYKLKKTENDNNAVINVAFWGVSPRPGNSSTIITPTRQNPYTMSQLFADAISLSASTFIKTENIQELVLLIIPIPRDSELNKYFKNTIPVHSELLYIIWDKNKIPNKPDFDGIKYEGLEFPLSLPKSKTSSILLQGTNKSKINYTFLNDQESKGRGLLQVNSTLEFDASKIQQIALTKQKGFNLVRKGEQDSTEYMSTQLLIDAITGNTEIVKMVPIEYNCIYLDASQIKNKSRTSQLLDSLSSIPGGFMVYLSRRGQPIVARNKEELESLQNELYNITFQPPMVLDDLKRMSSYARFESISKRVSIKYHLILSNDVYTEKFKDIKNNLSQQCNCNNDASFTVYLSIPRDELTERIKDVNYIFLK